jgi:hypothetical protein
LTAQEAHITIVTMSDRDDFLEDFWRRQFPLTDEAARRYGVSRKTLYDWLAWAGITNAGGHNIWTFPPRKRWVYRANEPREEADDE